MERDAPDPKIGRTAKIFFFSVSIFRRLTHLCVFVVSASVFVSVCLCLSLSVQAGRHPDRQASSQAGK